jgi:hypothetical protein
MTKPHVTHVREDEPLVRVLEAHIETLKAETEILKRRLAAAERRAAQENAKAEGAIAELGPQCCPASDPRRGDLRRRRQQTAPPPRSGESFSDVILRLTAQISLADPTRRSLHAAPAHISIRFPPHSAQHNRRRASGTMIVSASASTFTSAACLPGDRQLNEMLGDLPALHVTAICCCAARLTPLSACSAVDTREYAKIFMTYLVPSFRLDHHIAKNDRLGRLQPPAAGFAAR